MTILEEYQSWLLSWASDKTVKARVNMARGRLDEWGLEGFTTANIAEFMARPRQDGKRRSRFTQTTYYANLKDFCTWLVAAEYLDVSPMDNELIRRPSKPKGLPRPLSEAQIETVMAAAHGRVRDWLTLALYAGLRAHEIAKVRGEDVSADGIYVLGKGGKEAVLPPHPEILKMAQRYPAHGWWFPDTRGSHVSAEVVSINVGRLFHSLGIAGSVHRMRHAYGTRLLRKGVNIRRVQTLMRHDALETTALYTAVDESELQDAINLLPSLEDDAPPPAA